MSHRKAVQVGSSLTSTITLNDGVQMPLFGLGTYLSEPGKSTEEAVTSAVQQGYKLIDTAQFYANEADCGQGVKRAGQPDIFMVTKVKSDNHGYDKTVSSVKESLTKLGTNSVDLVLIHSPFGGKNVESYKALHDLKKQGLIRSAGVSNFGIAHLEGLKNAGLPSPSVNQIELHPYHRNEDIVKYCRDHDIAVMGYCPLTRCKKMDDPDLVTIANKHNKSIAQVLIRWSVQQGFITIPKSTNPGRILENTKVFDFNLSEDELKSLDGKPDFICGWDPTTSPWEG